MYQCPKSKRSLLVAPKTYKRQPFSCHPNQILELMRGSRLRASCRVHVCIAISAGMSLVCFQKDVSVSKIKAFPVGSPQNVQKTAFLVSSKSNIRAYERFQASGQLQGTCLHSHQCWDELGLLPERCISVQNQSVPCW